MWAKERRCTLSATNQQVTVEHIVSQTESVGISRQATSTLRLPSCQHELGCQAPQNSFRLAPYSSPSLTKNVVTVVIPRMIEYAVAIGISVL